MPTRPILFLLFLTFLLFFFNLSTATNNGDNDDDYDLSFLDELDELDTPTPPHTDENYDDEDQDFENYDDFEVPSDFEHEEEENSLPSFDETHVVVLTDRNFTDYVDENKYVLVEFYAPWCGHCKSLAPEFAQAAKELKESDSDVRLVKVDGTKEVELAEEFDIQGFPTLFWFVDGERAAYNGPRHKDGIVTWIKKKTGPGVSNITTIKDAEHILTSEKKLVLGFFDSLVGPESVEFAAASKLEDDVTFYQTNDPKVAKIFHLESDVKKPAVVLIKKEAEKVSFFEGQFEKSPIAEFISANKLPLVTNFTRESASLIFESSIKKQVLLFSTSSESEKVFSTFEEAAKSFKQKLIFVYVNADDEETGKPVADYFGVSGDTPKIMGYTGNDDMRKFFLEGEITTEKIKAFGEAFLEDKLKPFYKSDPVPETNDGDVKIIVGNNFDDIVLDESKDVLLEVYAPWCGHCEAFEPTYNKLAKHLHSVESLVIAKMDGTTNEHPKAKAEGFPTILFFPAGKKSSDPIVVESERTVKGLYKFIKEHASVPFKLQKAAASSPVSEDSNAKEAATSSHTDVKDEL